MDFFKNRILNQTVTVNWYLLAYPHTKKIITTKTMYIHKFCCCWKYTMNFILKQFDIPSAD